MLRAMRNRLLPCLVLLSILLLVGCTSQPEPAPTAWSTLPPQGTATLLIPTLQATLTLKPTPTRTLTPVPTVDAGLEQYFANREGDPFTNPPQWMEEPPPDRHIELTHDEGDWYSITLSLLDSQNHVLAQFSNLEDGWRGGPWDVLWSPSKGRAVVHFSGAASTSMAFLLIDRDGNRLSDVIYGHYFPVWSPTQDLLAFEGRPAEEDQLGILDGEGTLRAAGAPLSPRLCQACGDLPEWSPNGSCAAVMVQVGELAVPRDELLSIACADGAVFDIKLRDYDLQYAHHLWLDDSHLLLQGSRWRQSGTTRYILYDIETGILQEVLSSKDLPPTPLPPTSEPTRCPWPSLGEEAHSQSMSSWSIETVDKGDLVGMASSLSLDSSAQPHITYFDMSQQRFKYAYMDGSTWAIETMDETEGRTSLVLDSSNRPHIAYWQCCGEGRYTFYDGTAWQTEVFDRIEGLWLVSSLVFDSQGRPHIGYGGRTGVGVGSYEFPMRYAYLGATGWQTQTLPVEGSLYDLVLDRQNFPHVVYLEDAVHPALVYAYYDGASWIIEPIPVRGKPISASLALDRAGQPHIVYSNGPLTYARRSGAEWQLQTVDDVFHEYSYPTLILDSLDRPHISYGTTALRYVYYDGIQWQAETVDAEGGIEESSLALDAAGLVHISYRGDGQLKYAYQETRAILPNAGGPVGLYALAVGAAMVFSLGLLLHRRGV